MARRKASRTGRKARELTRVRFVSISSRLQITFSKAQLAKIRSAGLDPGSCISFASSRSNVRNRRADFSLPLDCCLQGSKSSASRTQTPFDSSTTSRLPTSSTPTRPYVHFFLLVLNSLVSFRNAADLRSSSVAFSFLRATSDQLGPSPLFFEIFSTRGR